MAGTSLAEGDAANSHSYELQTHHDSTSVHCIAHFLLISSQFIAGHHLPAWVIWRSSIATRAIVIPRAAGFPMETEPASRSWDGRQMQTSPLKSPFNKTGAAVAVRVLRTTKELRCHPLFGYTMAFVFVGLATLLQWAAGSLYENTPFLTIFLAIIVVALIGGRGPGFLAAILAGGSQWTLFIPALHWLAVASYAVDATICVMLIDYINRTLDLLLAHIDREKQAKQHQSILAKELHHRIQNLFTVIQGVVRFSLPGDGLVHAAAVRERLMDRLQSMSAANRAITDSMGDGVHLLDLISGEIRGFEAQFEIGGTGRLLLGAHSSPRISP
jgi:hypothetical protein